MSKAMIFWACAALVLMGLEAVVPGAFLLWLGIAASGTFLLVWALPGLTWLWQVVAFAVLSFISIATYLKFVRKPGRERNDQPLLNRKGDQMIGQVIVLETAIVDGQGRAKIGDAFWTVQGVDLPAGRRVRIIAVDSLTLKVDPAD
jgi:inner membrane protein